MKVVCAAIAIVCASMPPSANAQQPGQRVRVALLDGSRSEGTFVAIGGDSVTIRVANPERSVTVPKRQVATLEVHALPTWRKRAMWGGAAIGAVGGAIAGSAAHRANSGSPGLGTPPSRSENIIVGTLLGGVAGWAIGRLAGGSRWQRLPL